MPKYAVTVRLTGTDGNAFAIIAAVGKALRKEVGKEAQQEWQEAAFKAGSYEGLLALAFEFVEIE